MSYRERKVNSNGTYSQYVHQTGSDVQQPVDIQSRYQQTIQTHNAVSVAANGSSIQSAYLDTNGFDSIAITVLSDNTHSLGVDLHWSNDGTTLHGNENIVPDTSKANITAESKTKARYVKVALKNRDTAAAHIMSAWAYLKA